MSDIYKVSLSSVSKPEDIVVFNVTPQLSENRSVQYKQLSVLHLPGSINAYENTTNRTFNLNARLISRTIEEATKNSQYLQLIRSWTLPYFGKSTNGLSTTQIENRERLDRNRSITRPNNVVNRDPDKFGHEKSLLGQPPEVLYLNAYSDRNNDENGSFVGNLNNVPVLITYFGNDYPSDVAYFPTIHGEPFPVVMNINFSLMESHSPKEYNNFSLSDFKNGRLQNF